MTARSGDRGSASLEAAVVFAPLLFLALLVVYGARVMMAGHAVEDAAAQAAREASIARSPAAAQASADTAARVALGNSRLQCASTSVALDLSAFGTLPGQDGEVTAQVTCEANLADIPLPGGMGSRTITRAAGSPLDTYRERG